MALAIFCLLVALALPVDFLSGSRLAGQSQVRFLLEHPGIIAEREGNSNVVLPENSTIELSQILSGVPYPVDLQLWIDGTMQIENTFEASGIRGDGAIRGMGTFTLPPGTHNVEIRISDREAGWRTVFLDQVEIQESEILTLIYDQETDIFEISK